MKMKTRVILFALLILAAVCMASCGAEPTPYEINDSENYTVSVKYDANGGEFTTNTYVIVDSYSADDSEIALLSPDDDAREADAFTPVKNGHFLAGWYAERSGTQEEGYTYSGKWDFEEDRLSVDPSKEYSAQEPALTLYAAWVPMFEIEFYNVGTDELIGSYSFDPTGETEMMIPSWDEESGSLEMYRFPELEDKTFVKAYTDKEGTQPLEGESFTHTGSVNYETGTANDPAMKLYIEWADGKWYHIYTAEQFIENASVSGSYEIMADLDFTDKNWPTSFMHGNFKGSINGNGHTFSNILFEQTNNSKANSGLFGNFTEEAAIKDLTFDNVTFTVKAGTRVAGATFGVFAGTLSGEATLENVKLTNSRLQIDSGCYFGVSDYTVGRVCGIGNDKAIPDAEVECLAVGEAPENVKITKDGNSVELEFLS